MTRAVDLVVPVAKIPEILAKYGWQMVFNGEREGPVPDDHRPDRSCSAIPRAAVPHDRPRHREAHAHGAAAGERLCDDPPARPSMIVKGYEFERGSYVTIADDELKDLQIESSKIIWHSGANGTNVNRGRLTLWIPSRSARGLRAPIGAMFRAW
jgi:hypothetical protein